MFLILFLYNINSVVVVAVVVVVAYAKRANYVIVQLCWTFMVVRTWGKIGRGGEGTIEREEIQMCGVPPLS